VRAAIASVQGGPHASPAPGERVVDFLVDPGIACQALDALAQGSGVVLRAAPEAAAAAPGYGPVPVAPWWIRLVRGSRDVTLTPLRGGEVSERRAARVEVETHEEACCDASSCSQKRTLAEAWLVLEGEENAPARFLIAQQRAGVEPAAQDAGSSPIVRAVAPRVAQALGVPLHFAGAAAEMEPGEAPAPVGPEATAEVLARFAARREGDRVVVRDWDSRGPRASATRNAWIGAALLAVAAAAWVVVWRAVSGGGASSVVVAASITGALFAVGAYAFLGVARFAAKYRATSAPLAAVWRDRIVVLPWVARDGAVDARPEGRLGAAIPLVEVRSATPRRRGGDGDPTVAVALDTDHGPIDAMICPDEASAALWCAVLDRLVDEARHPRQGATARQRARARARAGGGAAGALA
jgi:hypothetical protein